MKKFLALLLTLLVFSPPANATFPVTFATLAGGNQPLTDFDVMFNTVGSMGQVMSNASGTNTITLTPITNMPTIGTYNNYQEFGFVAVNNSTGAVSINVSSIGALPLYSIDGVSQAGVGSLLSGVYYQIIYNSALNSGLGGFQIMSPNPSQFGSANNNTVISNISGSPGSPVANNAASVGSSLVLIGSQTANNSASLVFSSIPSTYNEYELHFQNLVPVTNGAQIGFTVGTVTTGYVSALFESSNTGGSGAHGGSGSFWVLTYSGVSNIAGRGTSGRISISGLTQASAIQFCGNSAYNTGGSLAQSSLGGELDTVGPYTSLTVSASTGNLSAGTATLYGVRNQ